ncbi:hypothetical protein Ancab_015871 [Ancistrocladus abbreviatus]
MAASNFDVDAECNADGRLGFGFIVRHSLSDVFGSIAFRYDSKMEASAIGVNLRLLTLRDWSMAVAHCLAKFTLRTTSSANTVARKDREE